LAYENLVDKLGPVKVISGLVCREIEIASICGVIVLAHRMGLVAAAVTSTMALERFEPKLICMSGICGGVPNNSEIYDVLVTDVCHQHDAGKWSDKGFRSEHYDVQIDPGVRGKLVEICSDNAFRAEMVDNLHVGKSEVPDGSEHITCAIRIEPTSSGSAVVAQDGQTASLSVGQRKLAGFEMEIFSVYEAARHAYSRPIFFAAKTVVDDGGANKGDRFHRIGCILSARLVVKVIRSGILDVEADLVA
jgi:nucleoside phosphorylase